MDKKTVMELTDLTSLNENDTEETITQLCAHASNRLGIVAAVCVYPQFVSMAKRLLKGQNVQVATVVNFPAGDASIDHVAAEVRQALAAGADEIDLVIPYQEYIAQGYSEHALALVELSKALCQEKSLKVILETGELQSQALIFKAATDAIISGADFIKTSTGKTPRGATLEAVKAILNAINENKVNRLVGLKISGGVKTFAEALEYIELAKHYCTDEFINPKTLRFGASSLVNNLLEIGDDNTTY